MKKGTKDTISLFINLFFVIVISMMFFFEESLARLISNLNFSIVGHEYISFNLNIIDVLSLWALVNILLIIYPETKENIEE